jgi:hypothetical protein
MRALRESNLNREAPDSARGSADHHYLSTLNLEAVVQALIRRQSRERQGRCRDRVETVALDDLSGGNTDGFGIRAMADEVLAAERDHVISGANVDHRGADFGYHARRVKAVPAGKM